jgi:hypothetical protein
VQRDNFPLSTIVADATLHRTQVASPCALVSLVLICPVNCSVPSQLKIISGGQSGADRAALDWAIANKIPHAGWCPKGRLAEDGVIPVQYQLTETPTSDVEERTEWNVRHSDGTVIFSIKPGLSGGTKRTAEFAAVLKKPLLHIHQLSAENAPIRLQSFVRDNQIRTLNIAGPRASEEPGIFGFVTYMLQQAFL